MKSDVTTVHDKQRKFIEVTSGDPVVEAVRQVLALAITDGKPHTTQAAAIVCERALARLEK